MSSELPQVFVSADCNSVAPASDDPVASLFITVVMPVRNEAKHIEQTLSELLAQDYDPERFEIMVVDGESDDRTPELIEPYVAKYENVRLLINPKRWSSAARNIGARNARGDVVVIVDGHCEINSDRFLHHIADAFTESGADCLGRPQPLDVSEATSLQRAIAAARSSRLGHHPESFIYADEPQFVPAKSVAIAYRREVFDQVGYFDESFDAHEDGEFNYRVDQAGLTCYFTPDVAVTYCPRGNLRGLFRQMVRYGRGRVHFSRKHPGTLGLGALIPALLVLYILLGGILAIPFPTVTIPYIAGLGIYAAAVATFSIALTIQERRLSFLLWLPLVFLTVHTGAGTGILSEAIAPKAAAGTLGVPLAK